MHMFVNVLMLTAIIIFGQAEVKLTLNVNTTVAFEGEELSIRVNNVPKHGGELKLCFKSTSDTNVIGCPEGYAASHAFVNQDAYTFQLNRQGQFLQRNVAMGGNVVFESNGQLNLILVMITSMMTVTLTNAEIPVITTTILAPTTAQTNSKATLKIIGIVVALVLLIFIVGAIALYFCWYRKRNGRLTAATCSEAHQPFKVRKADNKLGKNGKRPQKIMNQPPKFVLSKGVNETTPKLLFPQNA